MKSYDDDINIVREVFPHAYLTFCEGRYRIYPKEGITVDIGCGKSERLAWHDAALNL